MKDLTGCKFGEWLVLSKSDFRKSGHIYWNCKCSCGAEKAILGESLKSKGSTKCWTCGRKIANSKIRKNPTRKYWHLKYNYNLSYDKVRAILSAQDHKCAICKKDIEMGKFSVDHNHKCCNYRVGCQSKSCGKCVRGFLCRNCNSGIGLFKESIILIENAARYMKENENGIHF